MTVNESTKPSAADAEMNPAHRSRAKGGRAGGICQAARLVVRVLLLIAIGMAILSEFHDITVRADQFYAQSTPGAWYFEYNSYNPPDRWVDSRPWDTESRQFAIDWRERVYFERWWGGYDAVTGRLRIFVHHWAVLSVLLPLNLLMGWISRRRHTTGAASCSPDTAPLTTGVASRACSRQQQDGREHRLD